jgi:hypothetical protein
VHADAGSTSTSGGGLVSRTRVARDRSRAPPASFGPRRGTVHYHHAAGELPGNAPTLARKLPHPATAHGAAPLHATQPNPAVRALLAA